MLASTCQHGAGPTGQLCGEPSQIFLVNFVVQRRTVLFRTAEFATKLFTVVMNNRVAFEADDHIVSEGWSVIVKGRAQVLNSAPRSEKRNEQTCCRGRRG